MANRRKKREDDLARELQSHLDLEAEEAAGRGVSADDARFAARRALGNTVSIQEATRATWGFAWLDELVQDLRYGCRALRKSPGFAAVAILTAGLGIGANTSIFSVVHAVLMHPLPYREADRLVVPMQSSQVSAISLGVADFEYAQWRDQAGIWDGIAAYAGRRFTLTGNGDAEELRGEAVTPGFLHVLGVAPAIGRDLTAEDAAARGGPVALVSDRLWKRRLGGDASVLEKTVTFDGRAYRIAGVLPRNFEFPENADVQVIVAMREPGAPTPNGAIYFYNVLARLKPGVTIAGAQAAMQTLDRRLEPTFPVFLRKSRAGSQARVIPLREKLVNNVRPALLVLAGAVGLVLLIACVNISNLLLARAISRQKEIAVRVALGAGRGRVARQLLTEGLLLGASGGAAGLALAYAGAAMLRAIAPLGVPHIENANLSGAVLAFNLAVALGSGVLFGLAPLRGAARVDPEAALRQTTRSASGGRQHRRLENLLVVSEVAFALILLAGAGLLLRTFATLTAIAPGFQPDGVLTAQISLPLWKYRTPDSRLVFLDSLLEKVRVGPSVSAASAVACLPYSGPMMTNSIQVEGQAAPPKDGTGDPVAVNIVTGDYIRTLQAPILEGRAIDDMDRDGREEAAMVNRTLAQRYFGGKPAVGSRIRLSESQGWMRIVGVIGDLKQSGLASEVRPELFQSARQAERAGSARMLSIRSDADSKALISWLRQTIAAIDKDIPPPEIDTMRERMASLVATQRFVMRLLGLFAVLAILLAAIGIYSVLVYSVERRAHEIGIRVALGARQAQIIGLVMSRGLRLSLAGSAIGTAGGLLLTRYLKSLLYGVTPHDPLTLGAGCAVVIGVAAAAAYFPARRAVGQNPIATLRGE